MERGVIRRVAAAIGVTALGLACAVLAADVRSWKTSLPGGDAIYAASPSQASWTPHTRLGGLSADLLSVDADVAARRALQRYTAAANLSLRLDNALAVQSARAQAQDALTRVAASSNGAGAGQALTLLGVLTFGGTATGAQQDQVDAAASDFADAIRADPSNSAAKFDLELLLRQSIAHGTRTGQVLGGGFGRGGRRGAGGGSPGRGY
jgi:ABC-type phosphate transport system substrate-binding protein